MSRRIVVTGAAGFIGAALVENLLKKGENVIGLDNLNSYYEISLKNSRLGNLKSISESSKGQWEFLKVSLENKNLLANVFKKYQPEIVVNLAAQAGVRHSIENPSAYFESNLLGFSNLIEECRKNNIKNLIFASSSSVYGGNKLLPYSEKHSVNHPISLYAATKRANELIAHSYSHLYKIPCTGLRFFTVYGPWGRPDMSPMIFAKAILSKEKIKIFNYGEMERDFTYIDDVVEVITKCCLKPAISSNDFDYLDPDPSTSFAPFRLFNVGNSNPINILEFVEMLENNLKIKAVKNFIPIQPGDVKSTSADTKNLESWIGYKPSTSIDEGIRKFTEWYYDYYHNNLN